MIYKKQSEQVKAITAQTVFGTPDIPVGARKMMDFHCSVVDACLSRTSEKVAQTPLRLYKKGNAFKSITGNRIKAKKLIELIKTTSVKNYLGSGEDLTEVYNHPALAVLKKPNSEMTGYQHLKHHQSYLDTFGVSYTRIDPETDELWLLPPSNVTVIRDNYGKPVAYQYGKTNGQRISIEEIAVQSTTNLSNPYFGNGGTSPVKSVAESLKLMNKVMDTMCSIMDNQGRPSGILSPKGDYSDISVEEAERWKQRYRQFMNGGQGEVMVLDSQSEFTPLTQSPTDLAILQFMKAIEDQVAQAFGIPSMILRGVEGGSRAAYQTALQEWTEGAITARLRQLEDFLNYKILPLFDDTGSLFFAFDSPTPDIEELQAELGIKKAGGAYLTINEVRSTQGFDPIEGGDTLRNVSTPVASPVASEAEDKPEAQSDTEAAPVAPVVASEQELETSPSLTLNGAQIQSASAIVSQVALGELPRDSGIGQLEILLNLSNEQAERIMGSVGITFFVASPEASPLPQKPTSEQPEKAVEELITKALNKPIDIPTGKKLEPILKAFFDKQYAYVSNSMKSIEGMETKGLPKTFVPLAAWTDDLAAECQPVIEIMIDKSGQQLLERVGASPDVFAVFNKEVKAQAKKLALNLSKSTLDTTTKAINDALDQTRQAMAEGLEAGESVKEMANRLQDIFQNAEKNRVWLIAQTEASKAHHEGLRVSAKESGVVKYFEWLSSSDPCPLCQELNGKTIKLDGELPPRHPGCMCAVLENVDV